MTQHTPGPWSSQSVTSVNERGVFVYKRIVSPQGKTIVSDRGYIGDNAEANARLIAAAPELLKTLKDAHEWIDAQIMTANSDQMTEHDEKVRDKAEASIAKATQQPNQ